MSIMNVANLLVSTALALVLPPEEVRYLRFHQEHKTMACTMLEDRMLEKYKGFRSLDDNLLVNLRPTIIPLPGDDVFKRFVNKDNIVEVYSKDDNRTKAYMNRVCRTMKKLEPVTVTALQESPEVRKVMDSGNQANRIDVVFMGDGYTLEEREKFFGDIKRLTTDMFEGITFRSYLPLFNIWAIFVPSMESGIGTNGPIDTAFRLYREHGQLRAIYPGNANYARQVCQLTGPSGCEYPSLIGNDDFYGGLGGEFVISTKSNHSGTMVLRHEMGHNFANVGEEYDGGSVYSGVNAAKSLTSLGWTHWLTSSVLPIREERVAYRLLEYLWVDLATTNVTLNFTSDGTYSRWLMTISVTASGDPDCLEFAIDGVPLPWTSSGSDDREFYEWYFEEGFTAGSHNLTIASRTTPTNPLLSRMVASCDIHELGAEGEFHNSDDHISAYPTWDYRGTKSYRPSNAGCLMRNMTSSRFCPVCKEGIWMQFMQRINLIDDVEVSASSPHSITVKTLQLGQLRDPGNKVKGERLELRWTKDGAAQPNLNDIFKVQAAESGTWTVTVTLKTREVRSDPNNLLTETEAVTVPA